MADVRTVNLGSIEKIPPGQGFCFIVGGEEISVFRQRDGRLFATENRCPHRQGPLSEGLIGAGKVICPLHAHKFDLTTGQGPAPAECLRVFPVRESQGEIFLTVEARPSRRGVGCTPSTPSEAPGKVA
ncbi:MAG TPA: nitrite reductase (NAD(P)H) small subunit [Planctomycetota bacterium]|nr:nitrite reductase (NAD(P)H) small subunit [Planctomycetota bacterium]